MKVLLDSCVSGLAAQLVRQAGHDVVWAGEWERDPGDVEILRRASGESRVLVTLDQDFGELAIVQGMIHTGLIRLIGFRARDQGEAINQLLAKYEAELAGGAILTAETWRVRVRAGAGGQPAKVPPLAKISSIVLSFTGKIPPGDAGDQWIRSTEWPLTFDMDVDAHLDRSVAATTVSVEIIRDTDGQRVERIVKDVAPSGGRVTIRRWRGTIKDASVPEPGTYRIVVHIEGVEPEPMPWQFIRK